MTRDTDRIYTLEEIWNGYQGYLAERKEKEKEKDPSKIISFFRFQDWYLPTLQFIKQGSGKVEMFIDTIAKSFGVEGARAIRYIPLLGNGKRYVKIDAHGNEEVEDTRIQQIFPKSFIARVSCSMRAMQPSNLVLDYVIDVANLQLEGIATDANEPAVVFRDIDMTTSYRRPDSDTDVDFDEWIRSFLAHREQIFNSYFVNQFR